MTLSVRLKKTVNFYVRSFNVALRTLNVRLKNSRNKWRRNVTVSRSQQMSFGTNMKRKLLN